MKKLKLLGEELMGICFILFEYFFKYQFKNNGKL